MSIHTSHSTSPDPSLSRELTSFSSLSLLLELIETSSPPPFGISESLFPLLSLTRSNPPPLPSLNSHLSHTPNQSNIAFEPTRSSQFRTNFSVRLERYSKVSISRSGGSDDEYWRGRRVCESEGSVEREFERGEERRGS